MARDTQDMQTTVKADSAVIQYAFLTLKSLLVINGAAAVSLLTFVGNTKIVSNTQMDGYACALMAFGIGVLFVAIASGLSYVSQILFDWRAGTEGGLTNAAQIAACLCVIASMVAFVAGIWSASSALREAVVSKPIVQSTEK